MAEESSSEPIETIERKPAMVEVGLKAPDGRWVGASLEEPISDDSIRQFMALARPLFKRKLKGGA